MASPIRVILNILFLFRNQISRRPRASTANFYGSLSLSLALEAEREVKNPYDGKAQKGRFDLDTPRHRYEVADYETMVER